MPTRVHGYLSGQSDMEHDVGAGAPDLRPIGDGELGGRSARKDRHRSIGCLRGQQVCGIFQQCGSVGCVQRLTQIPVHQHGGGADPHGGSGLLGLTDRMDALGGRLWLHSPPGAGTTVRAELPLRQAASPQH